MLTRRILLVSFLFVSVLILMSLLNTSLVFASPEAYTAVLEKTKETLYCKIDFTLSILKTYQSTINESNFSLHIINLSNDKTRLSEISSTRNVSAVRDFVKNVLDTDLKNARLSVEVTRSSKHPGLSKDQKQALKDAYKKAHDAFRSCQQNNFKMLGDKHVELFTKILDDHLAIVNRLAEKGIDTSGMKKVIEDATTQVVTPLKDALSKANSSEEVQAALRKYCLFNGCKNGVNFHFATRFEIEKLSATLAYIKANNISVSGDQVSKVQGAVTSARGVLAEMGTTQYTDDGKNVRNSIQSAYGDLKNVRVKAVRAQAAVRTPAKAEAPKEVRTNEQKR